MSERPFASSDSSLRSVRALGARGRARALALVAVGTLASAGCSAPPARSASPGPLVEVHGALRDIMHGDQRGPVGRVDEGGVPWFGVGALSGLRGEVTVAYGEVVATYPAEDGVRTVSGSEAEREAVALLVASRETSYWSITLERTYTLVELERALEQLALTREVDVTKPFPFAVHHHAFPRLELHVVDGSKLPPGASHDEHRRAGVTIAREGQRAELIGFWSRHHEGVFTRRGERVHVHALLLHGDGSPELTGHLDDARIPAGATLLLPGGP